MYRKYVIFALVAAMSLISISAQTPDPKSERGFPMSKSFAFSFDGNGSYLGVQTREVTKENFSKMGLREVRGVAVEKVVEGSPAAAAGLREGDVIVRFNGDDVTSGRKLSRLVSEVSPDHQARLTVVRGGVEQEITATIGKSPVSSFENGNFKFDFPDGVGKIDLDKFKSLEKLGDLRGLDNFKMPDLEKFKTGEFPKMWNLPDGESFTWSSNNGRQIGVSVYPLTKQLGDRYGVQNGLIINTVRENSAAAKAGLKAGDIIVDVDGKTVANELDLIRLVNEKKEGSITIALMRDGTRQTITVTPEASKDAGFFFRTNEPDKAKPMIDQLQMTRPAVPAISPLSTFFRDWVI